MYYIGIDIGTSSICGVAYNPETRETITVTRENTFSIPADSDDEKLQDPDRITDCVAEIIGELTAGRHDVASIGMTGQMHGILYVDRDGHAVSPLFTWQDGRGNRPMADGMSYAEFLTANSSYHLATGYGLVTHFYNLRNGLVPAAASRLCTIMDYAVMKLTGRRTPMTDYSNAGALGFFDCMELQFDKQAIASAGIDCAILPDIAPSAVIAGFFNDIPVHSAIGDNQASFIGSVADKATSVLLTVGTSSQISVYSPRYVQLPGMDTRPLPGGGYILVGAELCGGYSFTILKNFFRETARLICGMELSDNDIYTAMTSVSLTEHDTLNVETLFDGTPQDPGKRGKITGISTSNFLPQELISGFARGICEALHGYYTQLPPELREHKKQIVASGNGFRKNHLLRQAAEATFNLPLHLTPSTEEAAFGAALSPLLP